MVTLSASAGSGTGSPASRSAAICAAIASTINDCLMPRIGSGDDAGQIRRVRRVTRLVVSLEDHDVALHGRSLRRPACFRMLASVFGFKVALGLPATVTSPGFTGCVKFRWEPDMR